MLSAHGESVGARHVVLWKRRDHQGRGGAADGEWSQRREAV